MEMNKKLKVLILLLATWCSVQAQSVVTGKVTDQNGSPLGDINVVVKEKSAGTFTAPDGSYKITVPNGGKTLIFSSVGYKTVEVPVSGNVVNASLKIVAKDLADAVVIGYGTKKKGDLTASIVSVSAKDFQKGVITTPEQLIAGKVAGVQVTSNGGAPGSGSVIRIRGGASLNASNDPLIVIDGIPVSNSGIAGSPNPLSLINSADIESFSVLKDAAATAIYGARASNGVIIITTKKGKKGLNLNFSTVNSIAMPNKTASVLSAAEFTDYVKANGTAAQRALLGTESTNWQNEIFSNAFATDNNLSISGMANKMPFRVSLGYLSQDGILNTDNLNRFSAGINLNPKFLNDHLRVDFAAKAANTTTHFADRGAIGSAVSYDPTKSVRSNNARYGGFTQWLDPTSTSGLRGLAPRNPVGLIEQRNDNGKSNRVLANVMLDYKMHFLPELRAVLNLGIDKSSGSGTIVVDDSAATAYRVPSSVTPGQFGYGENNQYKQSNTNSTTEFTLNYAKDIAAIKSKIDVMAGTSYQTFESENTFFDSYAKNGVQMGKTVFPNDIQQNRLFSYLGRLGWTINNKYIIALNARRDYSSRFNPDNRFGDFYGASFAWKLKQEKFLENVDFISDLKLRAGHASIGNQEGLGNYDFLSFYNQSNLTAQYQFGSNYYSLYRPGAYDGGRTWESTASTNVGLDFGIFKNRVTGSIDVYRKKTSDLLAPKTQSAGTNFANIITANIGDMENRGVELALNILAVKKKDFNFEFAVNATYNKNEITNLTEFPDPTFNGFEVGGISGGTGNTIQIHTVGSPRSSFYVYQQVYDPNTQKPLENIFVDRNGDGQVTDLDRYRYNNPDPTWFFGFSPSISYKKWNLGAVLRANVGNYVYNNVASATGVKRHILNPLNYLANGSRNVLESGFEGTGSRYFLSDYYMENASFLRMDNLNIGFNAGKLIKKLDAGFRFNFAVQNVFVSTKYTGIDPEVFGGIDNNIYPRPTTYSLGVNVDLNLKK